MTNKKWEINSDYGIGRTYSSASEAFKDADYATGLWRCETDSQKAVRWIKDGLFFVAITITCFFCIYLIADPIMSSFLSALSKK